MADTFFTLGTRVDSASLNTALRQISSAIRTVEKRGVNVKVDAGKFTRPLGKITGATNEFTKSLEASNARVLAFGASAGAIYQVQRAFEFLLKSTIEVEKQLQDVNVILGESEAGLARFGKGLFEVAGRTAQSINTVATAATELARQGLSTAETLQRTNDALILTRLSGMEAEASVSSLTAALNTFNREALTSTQVINKLANVDAAFAVSTDDLAQSMRRVGSTAQDVGVSFDQLLAITASVQQTTARGGPVIGNALKSIFTRIQRTDTLDLLERLGVTVRDLEHQMLPAMQVLGNLAKKFPTLSKAQQAHTAEVVAGVFQMNNLRAILGDMSKEFSIYDKAVKVSTSSTNEAILRNELLNKTLDAQLKKTMALATQAAKKIGDLTLKPVAERVVGIMQKILGDFNEKDGEEVGSKIAKGILGGLGNFLSGPGLLLITGFLGKLGINLSKFVKESGAQFMGLNTAAAQQKTLQESIHTLLQKNPQLIKNAATSTEARVIAERQVLQMLEKETQMMLNMEKVAASMAGMAIRGGAKVTGSGAVIAPAYMAAPRGRSTATAGSMGATGSAKGLIPVPNFNRTSALAEVIGAAEGGYKAGKIRQVSVPNLGRVTYNTRETIKHVPGFAQPFINPPANSRAGRKHKAKAIRQTGVDPYSVPNFAGGYAMGKVRMFPKGLTVGTMDYGMGRTAAANMGTKSFNPLRFWRSGPKSGGSMATEIAMARTAEGRRLGTVAQGSQKIVGPKPPPMLREAWEQAIAGHRGAAQAEGSTFTHLAANVGGKGGGALKEIMVGRERMDPATAKTFYNTLMNPSKTGPTYTDALGGTTKAAQITEKIIYQDGASRSQPRSFIAARKEATKLFRDLPNGRSAAGSFHARAEDIHTKLLEKTLAGEGNLRLMPFSNVGEKGVGNTILDALVLKKKGEGFGIQGPAEFKPTFGGSETGSAGRDARGSLSFKSLFSSTSGDSGGMLHWLREGLSKRQAQLLKSNSTTEAAGVKILAEDLNSYVVRTKVDDFKRLQGTVNQSVQIQGETGAVKMEEIFGKNITGLLKTDYSQGGKLGQAQQDRDMATAYDKVMRGFGAAKGYIPKKAGRTGIYDSDKIGGGGMGGKARGILEAILNSGKKVNVIMGPSGSGKSTYGKQIGPHVTSEKQLGKFDQYTILYGGKPARKGGGLTAQGQLIFDAAKRTGGRMQAIALPRDEVVRRRTARLSGSGDKSFKRSRKQLEGAMHAPGTNYGFLSNIRKKGYNLELITKAMGHVPNFMKYQIGQKLPWGRGAGGRHLAVRDKNMGVHYDPKAGFHADLVRRSKLEGKTMDGGWLLPSGKYEKIKGHDGSGLQAQGLIPNFAGGMPFAPGMFSKALLKKVKDVSRHGDRPYYMLRDAGGSVVDVASHTHRGLMGLQKERMKYPDSTGIFTSKDHWNAPPVIGAGGFVPSFAGRDSALQRAFKREKKATGLPSSKIYATTVDTPRYKGTVVANKRDERTRADLMSVVRGHPNPSRAGITAGRGFVPNYADSIDVMGISSMAMMAGMMMQGMGKNAEQKQQVEDQKKDHKAAKQNVRDQKARVKLLEKVNKRAADRRQMAQTQAETARKQGEKAAKERMSARQGALDPKTGTRGPSIKQLQIDQQKAADRIVNREVKRAIMHGGTPTNIHAPGGGPTARLPGLGFGGVHAEAGGGRGINPATGLPHTAAYNAKIEKLRGVGFGKAQRIISQATTGTRLSPRGAAGEASGDKAAKDLTKKTLLLQQARDRESSAAGRQTEANRKREAAQRAAWAQDKKVLAGQEKLTAARAKEAAMAASVKKNKPPSRAAAFIREKGFGVGFGIQIAAGIAEQFVGDTHTVEGRKKKSVVKGIGTVAGMAGTGAMIGGPWGAGIGAAIGGALAIMDYQKASKKTSEDYAKALQRETESRKKALLGAEAYIQMQTRMTGMVSSGAGEAERRNMRRMMQEQLMNVQDPTLRKELVASAGDTGKMREAMAKVQEQVAMQEKKGMIGVLSMKATEAKGSERASLVKDLGKTLSGAFDLENIDMNKLYGKDAAGMTVELKKMGVGAKEAGEMVEALTGKHKWMMRAAMEEALVYENLEEEVSRSTEGIQRMAVATADLNALMGKVMASFKQHSKIAEMTWDHSQKMSSKALESMMTDTTMGRGRREGFKLQNDILANIENNNFKNLQSSKSFHQAVMEWTVKQSGKGGVMPKNIQEVQNEARKQLQTGSIDEDKWRGIIQDGELSRVQGRELEATLNQQIGIIEQNTLAMSQNNQLLITQHRLREMERHFQSRRKLQEGLRVGGQPGERGIIDALRNFMDVPRIPGEREKRRAARGELRGINDLEAMGFSFEDSVGKAFKEKALRKAARSEAPAALEALGMSAEDVNKVVSSGFDPKIAKELIDNMKSSQAELMAQIIDAVNVGDIAKEERQYKRKLLDAEFQSRNALIKALGGNIDTMALLIGSNFDLIDANEAMTRTGWEQLGKRGEQDSGMMDHMSTMAELNKRVMGAATVNMSSIMAKASKDFSTALTRYRDESAILQNRINLQGKINEAALDAENVAQLDLGNLGMRASVRQSSLDEDDRYMAEDPGGWWADALGWGLGHTMGRIAAGLDTAFKGVGLGGSEFSAADALQTLSLGTETFRLTQSQKPINFSEWAVGQEAGGVQGLSREDQQIWQNARDQAILKYESDLGAANPEGVQDMGVFRDIRAQFDLFDTMEELNDLFTKKGMQPGAILDLDVSAEDWAGAFGGDAEKAEEAITAARTLLISSMGDWRIGMLQELSNWSNVKDLLGRETGMGRSEVQTHIVPLFLAIQETMTQLGSVNDNIGDLDPNFDVDAAVTTYKKFWKSYDEAGELLMNELDMQFKSGRKMTAERANELKQQIEQYNNLRKPYDKVMAEFNKRGMVSSSPSVENVFRGSGGEVLMVPDASTAPEGSIRERKLKAKEEGLKAYRIELDRIAANPSASLSNFNTGRGEGQISRENTYRIRRASINWATVEDPSLNRETGYSGTGGVSDESELPQFKGRVNLALPSDIPGGVVPKGSTVPIPVEISAISGKAKAIMDQSGVWETMKKDQANLQKLFDWSAGTDYQGAALEGGWSNPTWGSASDMVDMVKERLAMSSGGAGYEWADAYEMPMLAVQQSIDHLSEITEDGDDELENLFAGKQDQLRALLSAILTELISKSGLDGKAQEELKAMLKLSPKEFKNALDELNRKEKRDNLDKKLGILKGQGEALPQLPAPFFPQKAISGKVTVGKEALMRPLQIKTRELFIGQGKAILERLMKEEKDRREGAGGNRLGGYAPPQYKEIFDPERAERAGGFAGLGEKIPKEFTGLIKLRDKQRQNVAKMAKFLGILLQDNKKASKETGFWMANVGVNRQNVRTLGETSPTAQALSSMRGQTAPGLTEAQQKERGMARMQMAVHAMRGKLKLPGMEAMEDKTVAEQFHATIIALHGFHQELKKIKPVTKKMMEDLKKEGGLGGGGFEDLVDLTVKQLSYFPRRKFDVGGAQVGSQQLIQDFQTLKRKSHGVSEELQVLADNIYNTSQEYEHERQQTRLKTPYHMQLRTPQPRGMYGEELRARFDKKGQDTWMEGPEGLKTLRSVNQVMRSQASDMIKLLESKMPTRTQTEKDRKKALEDLNTSGQAEANAAIETLTNVAKEWDAARAARDAETPVVKAAEVGRNKSFSDAANHFGLSVDKFFHIMQAGETVSSIARAHGVPDWTKIVEEGGAQGPMTDARARTLQAGQSLEIPASAKVKTDLARQWAPMYANYMKQGGFMDFVKGDSGPAEIGERRFAAGETISEEAVPLGKGVTLAHRQEATKRLSALAAGTDPDLLKQGVDAGEQKQIAAHLQAAIKSNFEFNEASAARAIAAKEAAALEQRLAQLGKKQEDLIRRLQRGTMEQISADQGLALIKEAQKKLEIWKARLVEEDLAHMRLNTEKLKGIDNKEVRARARAVLVRQTADQNAGKLAREELGVRETLFSRFDQEQLPKTFDQFKNFVIQGLANPATEQERQEVDQHMLDMLAERGMEVKETEKQWQVRMLENWRKSGGDQATQDSRGRPEKGAKLMDFKELGAWMKLPGQKGRSGEVRTRGFIESQRADALKSLTEAYTAPVSKEAFKLEREKVVAATAAEVKKLGPKVVPGTTVAPALHPKTGLPILSGPAAEAQERGDKKLAAMDKRRQEKLGRWKDVQAGYKESQEGLLLQKGTPRRAEYDKERERVELLRADIDKGDKRIEKSDVRLKNLRRLDDSFDDINKALGTGDRVGKSVREGGLAPYEFQLLLQKVQTEAVKGMGGGLLQQAAIPSRLGEEQQGKIKTALGDLALLVKTDAMGETSVGLAVQREAAAKASLHKLEEDDKAVEKFDTGEKEVAQAKADREKARKALFDEGKLMPGADAEEGVKEAHRDKMKGLSERLEASKLAVERAELTHVETNFILIGANAKVTEATDNLTAVTNNVADARASLKDIEEEYGSTVALASRLMKQYANAEFIKTMEGLETSMAQASLRFQMLADSDKWDKLLKATQLLAETRLRLAIKERQLTEAAGTTTPQDTRQARGDLTRQQLRTGQIGVWEAYGQDTLDSATAASAGWKEQLLNDMIDIREGMIDAFGRGWQAFSMEGAKAKDVAKQWTRDFLGLINKAFYNATIGRLFRSIASGSFSGYMSGSSQERQEGGIIKAQNGMYISGNRTGDRNPALLEDGEYVLNKNLVNRIGKKNLDDANFGLAPRFAAGGFVPPSNLDPSTWPQPPNMNKRLNPKNDQDRFDNPALRGQFMEDGVPAFAPPAWHDKQMTLEFYKYWSLKQNKQRLLGGATPWGQAQSDSRRVRTLMTESGIGEHEMQFLEGFGLKEAKRPPQFLNGKIGPGWGPQLQWLGLPGNQEAARDELSEFGRAHPEALKHFQKSWLKNHRGWSNPQVYRKGGVVGFAGGGEYMGEAVLSPKEEKLRELERIDPGGLKRAEMQKHIDRLMNPKNQKLGFRNKKGEFKPLDVQPDPEWMRPIREKFNKKNIVPPSPKDRPQLFAGGGPVGMMPGGPVGPGQHGLPVFPEGEPGDPKFEKYMKEMQENLRKRMNAQEAKEFKAEQKKLRLEAKKNLPPKRTGPQQANQERRTNQKRTKPAKTNIDIRRGSGALGKPTSLGAQPLPKSINPKTGLPWGEKPNIGGKAMKPLPKSIPKPKGMGPIKGPGGVGGKANMLMMAPGVMNELFWRRPKQDDPGGWNLNIFKNIKDAWERGKEQRPWWDNKPRFGDPIEAAEGGLLGKNPFQLHRIPSRRFGGRTMTPEEQDEMFRKLNMGDPSKKTSLTSEQADELMRAVDKKQRQRFGHRPDYNMPDKPKLTAEEKAFEKLTTSEFFVREDFLSLDRAPYVPGKPYTGEGKATFNDQMENERKFWKKLLAGSTMGTNLFKGENFKGLREYRETGELKPTFLQYLNERHRQFNDPDREVDDRGGWRPLNIRDDADQLLEAQFHRDYPAMAKKAGLKGDKAKAWSYASIETRHIPKKYHDLFGTYYGATVRWGDVKKKRKERDAATWAQLKKHAEDMPAGPSMFNPTTGAPLTRGELTKDGRNAWGYPLLGIPGPGEAQPGDEGWYYQEKYQSGGIAITPEIKKSDWWRRGPGRQAQPTGRGVGHPGAYDPVKAKQALQWTGFWEGQEEFDRTGVRPTQSPYGDFPRLRLAKPNDDPARRSGEWYVEPGWKPIAGVKRPPLSKDATWQEKFPALIPYLDKDGNWKKKEGGIVSKGARAMQSYTQEKMREAEYFKDIPLLTRTFRHGPVRQDGPQDIQGMEELHLGKNKFSGPMEGSYDYINRSDIPGYNTIHNAILDMKGIKGKEREEVLRRLMRTPIHVGDLSDGAGGGAAGTIRQRMKSKIKGMQISKGDEGRFSSEMWLDKRFFERDPAGQDFSYDRDFLQQAYANELVHQIDTMMGGMPAIQFNKIPGGGIRNLKNQDARTKYLASQNQIMAKNLDMEWPKLDRNYLQNIKDNRHIKAIPEKDRMRILNLAAKGNMSPIHKMADTGVLNEKQHWILWEMARYVREAGPFTEAAQQPGPLPTSAKSYGGAGDEDWAIGVGKGNKGSWEKGAPYFSQALHNHLMFERLSHMGSVKVEGMQNKSRRARETHNKGVKSPLDKKRMTYGITDFAKGGIVGTYKEKGTARYQLKPGWDRSMGMTGADPLWEAMQKGNRVVTTAAGMVEAGLIHSFDKNDMEAAAVIYAETGPELYRQMDVVGNTLRNRKSSKGWSKDTSVHGAATRKHQFSAYGSPIPNWKAATEMRTYMKTHFKQAGWKGFEAKFGAGKTRAWQTALFYGSNKGQLSDRYGGVTSYTSPVPTRNKAGKYKYPTTVPGPSGLTPFAEAKFAHQTTAGGINVGAAKKNIDDIGFHLYDSPIEGDQPHKGTKYGTFLNTYTKKTAGVEGAGGSSFAPFLQRMAEQPTNYADRKKAGYKPKYRFQAPSSRKDLGSLWRLYGGHTGWMGRSKEDKLSANIQMAAHLYNRNEVGASASRRFLKQIPMDKILKAAPDFKELNPKFKKGGLVAFRGGGPALSGGSRAGYVAGGNHVDDDVRADLHNGDFVMTQKAVGKYGKSFFNDLQSGRLKFESGGVVEEEDIPAKSHSEVMGDISSSWENRTGVDDFDARWGNFQEGSEIVWGDRGDPAPKTNAGWEPTLEQKQSLEGGASLNAVYGDALDEAWGGAPSEYGMAGIATQDKTWYGAGHMPGAGMVSTFNEVEKGFSWNSANTLALNDPKRPSLAKFIVSEDLSGYALEDSNNPMNEMKKKREGLFVDYKNYLKDEFESRKKAWDDFRRKKKQLLKGAWIQAAVTVAMGAVKQGADNADTKLTDDAAKAAEDSAFILAETPAQIKALNASRDPMNAAFGKPAWANAAAHERWSGYRKWADTPFGAGTISGTTTAILGWGMGMDGADIAKSAGIAALTGATNAWANVKGAKKDALNAMNSSNPVIARAAIDQAHAADVITDAQKETALKNLSIRSARSMDLSTQRAILSAESGNELAQKAFKKAQGGNLAKLARATDAKDAAQVKLANAHSTRQGWIKNTNRRHPGMLHQMKPPGEVEPGEPGAGKWAFNADRLKELESIELNWDQAVNAMQMRQEAQRRANRNVDHLGRLLEPQKEGGPIGGYPYGRDTVPALVQGGEFIVSRDAAAGNYEFLNALNQQQISPQHLSSLPMARKGGGIRRYAEGGVVGAEMSQFDPLGSAGALATPAGAEGVSDSLIQLIDIVQGIKDTFDKETGDKAREKALGGEEGGPNKDGSVNQEITNNVNVTVNMSADGTTTAETESSSESKNKDGEDEEDDAEKNERFAELMQGVVLQTIIEEQRPGGLLYKT